MADRPRFKQKREVAIGALAAAITAIVFWASDFPGEALLELAIGAGAAIAAPLLYTVAQFGYAWLQAPMRLLTDDVLAIKETLERRPVSPSAVPSSPARPANVPFDLRDLARKGEEMLDRPSGFLQTQLDSWTSEAGELMRAHATADEIEDFMRVRGDAANTVRERVRVLKRVVYRMQHADDPAEQ
jgi:hypothetical protein